MKRALTIFLRTVVVLAVVAVSSVVVLTKTDFGHQRVRGIVLGFLHDKVHGTVTIGRMEGNILSDFSIVDIAIADSAGEPFLSAERVSARVSVRALLSKRVVVSGVTLIKPVLHVTKTPGKEWNYARIFHSPKPTAIDTTLGFGDWVTLVDVSVRSGTVTVQQPWEAGASFRGKARDSVIADAVSGKSRLRVDQAPYGLRQTKEFTSIEAYLPRVIVADPSTRDIVLNVETLSTIAAPFRPPVFVVRHFAGDIRVGPDTVTVQKLTLGLPGSHATGSLIYILASGDVLTSLKADALSLSDIRGLYPALPDSGGGHLDLKASIRNKTPSEYAVTNAALSVGAAQVSGTLGLTLDDSTTRFRDTDLRFTRFPTSLFTRIFPSAQSPIAGEFGGRARIAGDMRRMQVDVDGTFDAERQPPFRVVARGGLGLGDFVTADRLTVRTERLPVSLAKEFGSDVAVGGTIDGSATFSGSTASRFSGRFVLVHHEQGNVSGVEGDGTVAVADSMRMDLSLPALSISLDLAEHFAPETDFRGVVRGSATIRGTPRSFVSRLDLVLPGRGTVAGDVTFRLPSDSVPVYTAALDLRAVNVQRIVPKLPSTLLNGTTTVDGRGTDLATMDTRLGLDLKNVVVDSTELREVVVTASAHDGVLAVDSARVAATFGSATVDGNLGLVEGRTGTLRYRVEVNDVGGLARWIATRDTGVVAPRPGIAARLTRRNAMADSIRQAQRAAQDPAAQLAAEMGRARPRRARPTVVRVPPVPRGLISGSVVANGEATGQIKNLNLTAIAKTPGIAWGGNLVGAGSAKATWTGVGTTSDSLVVDAGVDSLRAAGFALDSTRVRGRYIRGQGDAEIAIYPGDSAEYLIGVEYVLRTKEGEVRLRNLHLRFDSTTWVSTRPSRISWRGHGVAIDSLELRNGDGQGGGRIFVNGEMPDVDPGRIEVDADSVRIAPWLTLLQSDVAADGMATLHAIAAGTRQAPQLEGTLTVSDFSYRRTPFPDLHSKFKYDQRTLTLDSDITRVTGAALAHVTGTLPLDLSFGDSVVNRLPEAPLALTIEGDSIPLAPIADFVEGFTALDGRAYGKMVMRGTWKKPQVEGGMSVDIRRLGLASTGVVMTEVTGRSHMVGDTLVIDSLFARSDGTIRGTGTIVFAGLRSPVLQLELRAADARVLDDERGELFADGTISAQGPIDTMVVGGRATVTRGVVYIPDPDKFEIINTEDPAIFAVVDTATALAAGVAPVSDFMKNLVLDVDVLVNRGTFGRSRDANIEVYGDLNIVLNPSTNGDYALTGALYTDYGDYTFLGKRFLVTHGAVRFTGDADMNPNLQVLATYEVRQAGRPPLDIRVVIGGTLERPRISLESDAQPTPSQSDLISFLAFGKSSSSLLQFSGTGLQGGGQGGSSLAGNVAALATRQLASIALGALADQAKADLAGATRADVLNITPAELPADLTLSQFQTLLRGTEIEIGKYVDRRTFVLARVRPTLAVPGASLERRFGQQAKLKTTFETRFQVRRPSLSSGGDLKEIPVFGSTLRWTLVW